MQMYQFEKIYSQMGKEYGKIKHGDEEAYALLLFPMEANALKVHRESPSSNSRRLREAIGLVLFDIKGRCEGETIDVERFRDADNERLEWALLMAFDPYTNEDIMEVLKEQDSMDLIDPETLREYYELPVMCLLRIKDSIDTMEKNLGSNGYFEFVEAYMGEEIKGTEMEFSVMTKDIPDM